MLKKKLMIMTVFTSGHPNGEIGGASNHVDAELSCVPGAAVYDAGRHGTGSQVRGRHGAGGRVCHRRST